LKNLPGGGPMSSPSPLTSMSSPEVSPDLRFRSSPDQRPLEGAGIKTVKVLSHQET
jgi:hypothetical protein